jgi:predicted glycogen debranching enzyme
MRQEWLVTNGLGSYACGTIAGARNRRYHGDFIVATDPPAVRTLLLGAAVPTANYRNASFQLSTARWTDGTVSPRGHLWLQRFFLDGTIPTWRWSLRDALIERRIVMVHGEDTLCQTWSAVRSSSPVQLSFDMLVDCRSHHSLSQAGAPTPAIERIERGVRLRWPLGVGSGPIDLFLQCDRCVPTPIGAWWNRMLLTEEQVRGYDSEDRLWNAVRFDVVLEPGTTIVLSASTSLQEPRSGAALLDKERARIDALVQQAHSPATAPAIEQLVCAADQFIVRRKRRDGTRMGCSIIAGYPWFGDWSRDALLSVHGLLLATGRHAEAKDVLSTLADWVEGGLLPNRLPARSDEMVERNSIDAPLLLVLAAQRVFERTQDAAWLRSLWPALVAVIEGYRSGTLHGIGVDPADGLVRGGDHTTQLTWMDARVGTRPITPRDGKAVEVNALWCGALAAMSELAPHASAPDGNWRTDLERARKSFTRFWNEDTSCCYDTIDGSAGRDASVRPNQLFAASALDGLLPTGQIKTMVDACMSRLWTPVGLRTLTPRDPRYCGHYGGDVATRDGAYHQGTAWPWLFVLGVRAYLQLGGDQRSIIDFIYPFLNHLREAGMGSVSEVFSGEPPHEPGGCPWQAWSVAALLEIVDLVGSDFAAGEKTKEKTGVAT